MNKISLMALVLVASCQAWGQQADTPVELVQGLDIQAERTQIAKERKASDDAYKAAVKLCFQKIAVNACKQEAQQTKSQIDNDLRRRELVLNDAERRENSAQALKKAQEKQSDEALSEQAERRREAQDMHLDKLENNLDKKEQRLQKEADKAANREARARHLEEVLERQRALDAKLKDAAKSQEAYQRKLQDAQQHRAQVERDRANRKPAIEPLPPRTDTQP